MKFINNPFKKNYFNNLSISRKLSLTVFINNFLVILLLYFVVIVYLFFSMRSSLINEMRILMELTAENSQYSIAFDQKDDAKNDLKNLSGNDSLQRICIFNQNKELFVGMNYSNSGGGCSNSFTDEPRNIEFSSITLNQLIKNNIGYVELKFSLGNIYSEFLNYFITFTIMAVIAILISSKVLSKTIIIPVANMSNTAKKIIYDNDYSVKVEKYYDDEIGGFADIFNKMLGAIKERDIELNRLNKNLERKVKDRTAALEEELGRRNRFAAHFSHEAKTPASNINGLVKSLLMIWETDDEKTKLELLDHLDKSADRLCVLIGELSDVTLLDSGATKLNMNNSDLYNLCKRAVADCESIKSKNRKKDKIKIKLLKPGFKTDLVCDESKIIQLVTNIVNNAVRYSEKGTIKIKIEKCSYRGPAYRVSVIDEGVGIPDKELKLIFNLGIQSTKTYDQSGGKGIGLTLAEKIVKCHKGKIWAENNQYAGATFTFIIKTNNKKGSYSV